jgi:hypothetical protein
MQTGNIGVKPAQNFPCRLLGKQQDILSISYRWGDEVIDDIVSAQFLAK